VNSFAGSAARVSVLLDVRHPLAYLALGPARALGEELALAFDWLPLAVPPLKPPSEPAADDDRGVRHRRFRAQAIAREIEIYGAAQGLVLSDYYREGDAHAANLAWLWVRARHRPRLPDFLTELFRAHWARELDPADAEAVARLVEKLGVDSDGLRVWSESEGRIAAEALASELRDFGLFQVPAFVVDDEVFYGRQHLPMIRWILGGRVGVPPC